MKRALAAVVMMGLGACATDRACGLVGTLDGATVQLRVPTSNASAPRPWAIQICRNATCANATVAATDTAITFDRAELSASTILGNADGSATITAFWQLDTDLSTVTDTYRATVTAADRVTLASLSATTGYTASMPNGAGCGVQWSASLAN